MTRHFLVPVALAILLLTCGMVEGQQRGQWSWFGNVSLLFSETTNPGAPAGSPTSSYERQNLAVSLGIYGFIVDPLVSQFSLFVQPRWSKYGYWDGGTVSVNDWRYGGSLLLFPRGRYSLYLGINQDRYDTSNLTTEDPIALSRAPETSSVYSARFRVQGGFLQGLSIGAYRSVLDFVDRQADRRITQGQMVDWRRGSKNFSHHYNLTRRDYDYGSDTYRSEDLVLTGQENGQLGAAWTWDMSLVGRDRTTETAGAGSRSFRTFRLFNRFVKSYSRGTSFRLNQSYATNQLDQSPTSHGLGISAGLQKMFPTGFTISTDLSYAYEFAGEESVTGPRASVSGDWRHTWNKLTFSLNGLVSYTNLTREVLGNSLDEKGVGYGTGGSLYYGDSSKLEAVVSAFWQRSDFQLSGEIDPEAPDLGVGLGRAQLIDRMNARLRLERRTKAYDLVWTSVWNTYKPQGDVENSGSISESFVHSLLFNVGRLNTGAGTGQVTSRGFEIPYESRFKYANFSYTPFSALTVQGSYRVDHRDLWPTDVDLERMDLTFQFNIGENVFWVQGYQITESAGTAVPRTTRGWLVTVSRGFRGWLPVVSSVSGRGVVR